MAAGCDEVDTDLLGLGVRVGVYLQVLAFVILLSTGGHSTLLGHGEAASATLFAVLVVIFYKLHRGEIHATEFACVLMMINIYSLIALMGVFSSFTDAFRTTGAWRVRTASREDQMMLRAERVFSDPPFNPANRWHRLEAMRLETEARSARRLHRNLTLQICSMFATWVLTAWFWQNGYKGLLHSGCGPVKVAFLYAPLPAFGGIRIFYLIGIYPTAVIIGLMLLCSVVAGLRRENLEATSPSCLANTESALNVSMKVEHVAVAAQQALLSAVTEHTVSLRTFFSWAVPYVAAMSSFVEMSMYYNGLQTDSINLGGLGNSGQILSLVVGFALVLSSLHAPVEPCKLWAFATDRVWNWVQSAAEGGAAGSDDGVVAIDADEAAFAAIARAAKADADMRLLERQGGAGNQAV